MVAREAGGATGEHKVGNRPQAKCVSHSEGGHQSRRSPRGRGPRLSILLQRPAGAVITLAAFFLHTGVLFLGFPTFSLRSRIPELPPFRDLSERTPLLGCLSWFPLFSPCVGPSCPDDGSVLSQAPNLFQARDLARVLVQQRGALSPTAPLLLPEGSSMETKTSQLRGDIARGAVATAAGERRSEGGNKERSGRGLGTSEVPGGRWYLLVAPPRDCALHNRGRARHKWRTPVQTESELS